MVYNLKKGENAMTEYLKNYIDQITKRLAECTELSDADDILAEHKDKIAFMQHERIVHFLVTMMFAVIVSIFMCTMLVTDNGLLIVLVTMIIILLVFYIKHYYFLENTVQKMYRIYDDILAKQKQLRGEDK